MTQTENYNLNIVEGSDKVNLLTQMNPNTTAIDAQMKDNADHGIQDATELFTSTVHAITRQNTDAPIFRFTAVSNYTAGETFTVDGVQVTALLTSGEALTTGSFIIGSEVICALRDTLLTVFVNAGTAAVAKNAEKLGGELPEYYGTAEDVADAVESAGTALETATAASTAVGNLSSLTTSSKTSAVSAINEVNENLAKLVTYTSDEEIVGTWFGETIYRKCYSASGVSIASGTTFILDANFPYNLVKSDGCYKIQHAGNVWITLASCVGGTNSHCNILQTDASNRLSMTLMWEGLNITDYRIIVEYTK